MEVADEGQLLGRVSCRLGLQGHQLIAAKHPGLRNKEDAALAVLHHRAAGVVLPIHWHLHNTTPWRRRPKRCCVQLFCLNLRAQAMRTVRRLHVLDQQATPGMLSSQPCRDSAV